MDSGKKSWKLDLMSSTRDVAYRVGPGVILMIFSPLALPPLSWGDEYQIKLPSLDWNSTSGVSSPGASSPGASPQVPPPQVPLPQMPLPQVPLPQGPLPRHLLTVRSHDGLDQNQNHCLLFLRHPPLFLVKLQSPLRQFSGQEPQIV